MGAVFADLSISLDGCIAGPNAKPGNPLGDGGERLHDWMTVLAAWREAHGSTGGDRTADDDLVRHVIERTGAHVMGRNMFDEGEFIWGENAPFHSPVFVVTHRAREPWVRKGGTTFYFVTEGAAAALEQAKRAAGGKDVRIAGGAQVFQQLLRAGLVDEFTVHVVPIILGAGVRLFDGLVPGDQGLEVSVARASGQTTHLTYQASR